MIKKILFSFYIPFSSFKSLVTNLRKSSKLFKEYLERLRDIVDAVRLTNIVIIDHVERSTSRDGCNHYNFEDSLPS